MDTAPDGSLPADAADVLAWWWPRAREILEATGTTVKSVMLFGSVTNGDYVPAWSDIDVAVFCDRPVEGRAELTALEEAARLRWDRSQVLEVVYVPPETLTPFGRLQLRTFGACYFGEPVTVAPPTRAELVADAQWILDDLARAPGDSSPTRLCGLLQEIARHTVYWRDGEFLSKSAALQREGGTVFELALAMRRAGSAACADHADALRAAVAEVALPARAQLAAWMDTER